jgi:hypothetical protein
LSRQRNVSVAIKKRNGLVDRNDCTCAIQSFNQRFRVFSSRYSAAATKIHNAKLIWRWLIDYTLNSSGYIAYVKSVTNELAISEQLDQTIGQSEPGQTVDKTINLSSSIKTWQSKDCHLRSLHSLKQLLGQRFVAEYGEGKTGG